MIFLTEEAILKIIWSYVGISSIFLIWFFIYLFYKINMLKFLLETLKKHYIFFLFVLIVRFFLLQYFTLWKPIVHYDEELIVLMSIILARKFVFVHYFFPVRPWAYPLFISFFNIYPFQIANIIAKTISFIVSFFSVVLLFSIYKKFSINQKITYIFTFLFSIASFNVFSSTRTKPDAFAVFFLLLFFYLWIDYVFKNKKNNLRMLLILAFFLIFTRFELVAVSFWFLTFLFLEAKNKKPYLAYFFILIMSSALFYINLLLDHRYSAIPFTFSFLYLKASFINKMILSPWIIFYALFGLFVIQGYFTKRNRDQKLFYLLTFFSFISILSVYTLYSFSSVERFQVLLYPFLFIGASSFNIIYKKFPRISWILLCFLLIYFLLFSWRPLIDLNNQNEIKVRDMHIFSSKTITELQEYNECLNGSIVYTGIFPYDCFKLPNSITVFPDTTLNEIKLVEERYPDYNSYFLLLSPLLLEFLKENDLNFLTTNESYSLDKIKSTCPEFSNETIKHFVSLKKPLSYYLTNKENR